MNEIELEASAWNSWLIHERKPCSGNFNLWRLHSDNA